MGHDWMEADCEMPKICSVCGEAEGEARGHTLQEATCDSPAVCSVCGETQGEKNPHAFNKWKPNGEEMIRFCKACELEEVAPLDNLEIVKDMLLGEWESGLIRIVSDTGLRNVIHTGHSITFQEDGTYVFQEEQTWTGTWELVRVNLPYYTLKLSCNEKLQQGSNYTCTIELWQDCERVNMSESEIGSRKMYTFTRKDAQAKKEAAEYLVGTWTSEMIGKSNSSHIQESRVVETGYTITAQDNGEVTISIEEEIKGTWVYSGKCVDNEGKSFERTQYLYSVIWEGSQNYITISVSSDTKLQFNQWKDNTSFYYYFGQKTAEEIEQFVKGPELMPGVWKSTLVEKRDIQADTTEELEEEYVLNVDAEGRYTSNIPQITNGAWAYNDYDPELGGHQYWLMPDDSSGLWYLMTIQDGKAFTQYGDISGNFYIYMEKNLS